MLNFWKISVSSRSSLISYWLPSKNRYKTLWSKYFRLLSEFSHFLYKLKKLINKWKEFSISVSSRSSLISYAMKYTRANFLQYIGFRLLLEFSHFLFSLCYDSIDKKFITHEFPSPLGVHLFLMPMKQMMAFYFLSFRLLSEFTYFLSYTQKNFCLQ